MHGGGADVRAFRTGRGVGFKDAGDAGFLDRGEPGGEGGGDREDRLCDVGFPGMTGELQREAGAVGFAGSALGRGADTGFEWQVLTAVRPGRAS